MKTFNEFSESLMICQILTSKFTIVSYHNLKCWSWSRFNLFWSFQIVTCYIQWPVIFKNAFSAIKVNKYINSVIENQPWNQLYTINRVFSNTYTYTIDTYVSLVQPASLIFTWVINMCSTLITKTINSVHYEESKHAGIHQSGMAKSSDGN